MKFNRTLSFRQMGKCLCVASFVLLFFAVAASFSSQEQHHGIVRPLSDVKFEPDDDVKCLDSILESGDPAKSASTFILRASPNCMVPLHYHTAEEQLIVVRGDVETGMDGVTPRVL